jgi:hypothetical protein
MFFNASVFHIKWLFLITTTTISTMMMTATTITMRPRASRQSNGKESTLIRATREEGRVKRQFVAYP